MTPVLQKSLGVAAATMIALSVSGCAETTGTETSYPKLAVVQRIKAKLLSKEEQEAKIKDLSLEQENHRGKAIEAIEKR